MGAVGDYVLQYLVVLTSGLAGACWLKSAMSPSLEAQSFWNRWAAGCATISAFYQAAFFFKSTPPPFFH